MEIGRLVTESPPQWVVLKITNNDQTVYKVFGGWRGGYTDGDRWKLNSGISRVEEDGDNYYFYGYSGSCYKCKKWGYGIDTDDKTSTFSGYITSILSNLIDTLNEETDVSAELMDKGSNWEELIKNN